MNEKTKFIVAIILFGSLWGFSEVLIGSTLNEFGFPSGILMTGVFAMFFLVLTRKTFKRPGMQMGMGLVAGGLRLFNPFYGCHICSAIAIMAEGLLFELIWYRMSFNFEGMKTNTMQISMGIISAFSLYVGGYIVTQVLTPIVAGAGFFLDNLLVFMPRILAGGLYAAIIGGITLPITLYVKKIDITVKDKLYYPVSIGISIFCWVAVIAIWFLMGA